MHNTLVGNESHTEEHSSLDAEHSEVGRQACSSEQQLSDITLSSNESWSELSCHEDLTDDRNSYISDNSSASADDSFCSQLDGSLYSDLNSEPDNSSESDLSSSCDINSDSNLSESDYHDSDPHSYDNDTAQQYSAIELQCLCVMSYVLRHNASGVATKDLIELVTALCPQISKEDTLTYDKVMSLAGNTKCKVIHYCSSCDNVFPDDPDNIVCSNACGNFRYKGPLSSQHLKGREPQCQFILADISKQLKFILERKGIWEMIQNTKSKLCQTPPETLEDITDGSLYHQLCQSGHFLNSKTAISAIMNTDGIPLYSSSNVKLWPVSLAINELPPSSRFARENMILAAIWQGKNKPPFRQYMSAVGEEICRLYNDGFTINVPGCPYPTEVKLGVFLATLDLQAKSYVLNMTMHNGKFGCSTCEEEGITVSQGKGYARSYPYRTSAERPALRVSDDVKYEKGPNATARHRIKGICGASGLASMPWFDIILGIVPDYMHSSVTRNN